MTRRILLIDADPTFRAQLSELLARYRIEIVAESDADVAVDSASANPPALLIVSVEEPGKAGFKVFQRCKKGALASVPIILVTSTVSAGNFAKHRGLKLHADEYIDRRVTSDQDTLAKIDQLITLGEPIDELDAALEVDEIALSNDDMVLEETVGEDDVELGGQFDTGEAAEAEHGGHARAGDAGVDSMVDAETDAAFAALLGDDPAPIELPPEHHEPAHAEHAEHHVEHAEHHEPGAVPSAIHDTGRPQDSGGVEFDSFSRESMRPPVDLIARARAEHRRAGSHAEPATPEPIDSPEHEPAYDATHEPAAHEPAGEAEPPLELDPGETVAVGVDDAPVYLDEPMLDEPMLDEPIEERSGESVAAIPIDVEDLEQLDEGEMMLEIDGVPADEPAAAIATAEVEAEAEASEPATGTHLAADALAADALATEAHPAVAEPAEPAEPAPPRRRKFLDASTVVETRVQAIAGLPAASAPIAPVAPIAQPVPDLGLDDIAQAEPTTDHSGVYDRRALRKMGELERQIAQLKTELDRSRATADAARGPSRERDFLNLREQVTTKDQELHRTRDELRARDRDLAEAQDRARVAEQARTTFEARAAEADAQLVAVRAQLEAEHATARDAAIEAATRAAADAVRAEAERTAVEREAGHADELARLHGEHAETLAQLRSAHTETVAQLRGAHTETVAQLTGERDTAIAQITLARDAAVAASDDEHHQVIARLQGDRTTELAQARDDAALQLQHTRDQLTADLEFVKQEAENRIAAINTARDRAVAELVGELERVKGQLTVARADHEQSLGIAAADQATALEELATQHAEDRVARQQEHAQARAADALAHETALAQLRAELEHQAHGHGSALDAARQELDALIEQHEHARGELVEQQRRGAEELAQLHAEELARLHADRQRALDDAQRATAAAHAAAEQALAEHRAELAQHTELTAREVAEHRSALLGVKRAMEEAATRHQAERDQLERSHAAVLEDHIAQHERALAVVHGEVVRTKAVGDAEHNKAIALLQADHERQHREAQDEHELERREAQAEHARTVSQLQAELDRSRKDAQVELERHRRDSHAEHTRVVGELTGERDELRRGLSSARDGAKRSETELATAVQTIADRNAELRAHAAAIAERDQRIAELRGEIEGLEHENANFQDQVLRAYQKIKSDEAMVARAKKAMAIALTVLDDQGAPKSEPT